MKIYVPLVTQMVSRRKLVAIIQEMILGQVSVQPVLLINVSKSAKLFQTAKWPSGIRQVAFVIQNLDHQLKTVLIHTILSLVNARLFWNAVSLNVLIVYNKENLFKIYNYFFNY